MVNLPNKGQKPMPENLKEMLKPENCHTDPITLLNPYRPEYEVRTLLCRMRSKIIKILIKQNAQNVDGIRTAND